MTTLALAAPTVQIGSASGGTPGALVSTPNILPTSETSLASNTGFSFPNNGAVLLRVCIGASGAGNLGFVLQRQVEGQAATAFTIAVANSTNYLFGPFSPNDFNDVNGLFQGTLSVQTGNSVGVYILPSNVYGK
jgi:hypothetical protein